MGSVLSPDYDDSWTSFGRRISGAVPHAGHARFPYGLAPIRLESCVVNHDVLKGRAPAGKECGMLQLDVPLAVGSMISYTFAKHVRKVLPEDYILDNLELITSPAHTTPPGRGAGLVAFDVRNSQWA